MGLRQEGHTPRRRGQLRLRPHYRDGIWYPGVALVVAALAVSGAVWTFAEARTQPPPTLAVHHVNGTTTTVPTAKANRDTKGGDGAALAPLAPSSRSTPTLLPGALLDVLSRPPVATSSARTPPLLNPTMSTTTTTSPPTTTTRPPTTTTRPPTTTTSTTTTTAPPTGPLVPQTTTTTTVVPQ